MHLRYYLDDQGKRVYTLQNAQNSGEHTLNAHPARFSPDDQFSQERMELKKRFNQLPTQQPPHMF